MLAGVPSDDGHDARVQCCGILTMQMRHLYRSPLSICLSSSLIRAFRASMVVAVDSSSVTLRGRQEKERQGRKRLVLTPDDAVHAGSYLPPIRFTTAELNFLTPTVCHPDTTKPRTHSQYYTILSPSHHMFIQKISYQQTAQSSSVFSNPPLTVYPLHLMSLPFILATVPSMFLPERPLINAQHDNGECAFNTVRQNMKRQ